MCSDDRKELIVTVAAVLVATPRGELSAGIILDAIDSAGFAIVRNLVFDVARPEP